MLATTLVRTASGDRVSAAQALKNPSVTLQNLHSERAVPLHVAEDAAALDLVSAETAIKYEGYLRRQESEILRARRDERRAIPANLDFNQIAGLSREVVQRLTQVRPDTIGQALRIPGVTPAAVAVLATHVARGSR